ncbi:putative pumilio domain-containing protein [Phaeoacremonium minimum UCRPA7]|uniref:Pumilio homology domain family member 3 n=1 Tax=Phaeoacremonium minimum (strain UCR-PA7) TaxID=1286976 RepID=R8BSD1_PHAM7|nr:putative pumilio domain-containing protein [Phaeoacremonium minimum UCRPA7]EOO02234.1 putative pumilio domain-containing protein [Phaeoacremonium minimum UCRPA7]
MGNGTGDKASQSLGTSFPSSSWQSGGGIWGNGPIGSNSFSKRETSASRASDESFNGASGISQLAAQSEADSWVRPGPWNTENPSNGNTSGSTSPTRRRDGQQSIHEISNTSPYFTTRTAAIGQGPGFGNRPKQNTSLDPSTGAFKQGLNGIADDKESFHAFQVPGFNTFKRPSQDAGYLNVGGSPNLPHSRPSETDKFEESGNAYGYQGTQSHRPQLAGPSNSFPRTNSSYSVNQSHVNEEELREKLRRSLTLEESSEQITNGLYSTSSQPFQFNPGSQPWETSIGGGSKVYGGYQQQDPYAESLAPPYLSNVHRRGPSVSRESPASSVYRQPLQSPTKSYGGTPPADAWSRPGSRDPRMTSETDRRTPGQPFLQQPAYYPPPYYNPNFPSQYPPQLFDPYTGHPTFRPPMPMPNYGLPVNPYLPGGVPIRPGKDRDPGQGVRSMLLEEFRSSSKSNKRYELKDIYNHVVEFSGDQHGSRFIQQKLETANSDEKDQVFREIEPNAVQLMKDVFGNYVIQKFFEHGNQVQKKVLAAQMKGKVVDLSTQMYACRVVQKALEHVLVEQQAELVKELEPEILRIVKDQNGNHVVQKIIELVPRQYIDFIMDAFRGQVSGLASHSYGCRVVQRMLEYGSEADKNTIMEELHACSQVLITDQYGNYVTQHVIQHGKPEDRSKMIRIVISQLVTLSKHKFASNVVEKCIEYGTQDERRAIRDELTTIGSDGTSPLQLMMKDQYGNYVIQKLLSQLEGEEREAFVEEMKPQFTSLKKVSTGRQIAAIDRLMSAVSSPTPGKPASLSGSVNGSVNGSVSGAAPASPGLQVEVNSAAPTPVLTMEPNSPQSSSPPSTNASAVEDTAEEPINNKESANAADPKVRVDDIEA